MAKRGSSSDRVFFQNAVKTIAANIRFASVDNPVSALAVTSSIPNEGKSTISLELARSLAAGGRRVLLVECDMRRRSLAPMVGVHARHGIYSVLSGNVPIEEAMVETAQRGLFFLDCEPHIPNPVDILSSRRFRTFVDGLRMSFSHVVFDTPPLSAFVDASVVGAVADGVVLVVRENFVRRDDLVSAYAQLEKAQAHVIGAVMNFCDTERSEYYYDYYASGRTSAPAPAPRQEPAQAATPPSAGEVAGAVRGTGAGRRVPHVAQVDQVQVGQVPVSGYGAGSYEDE